MLTQKQINEIKEHLERAQNPLFFFDNDQDGLCSFLLLQRYIGRGKGIPVKSFPELADTYFRKISELNADYIFILDKPVVSKEFFDKVEQINLPVVWIDHHPLQEELPDFVDYYNPLYNEVKTNEPVTDLCYRITNNKDDLWLAVVGCVSEYFMPDFYKEFKEKYPELGIDSKNESNSYSREAFDIYYKSQIGKVGKIFGFGLKDKTTNVIRMLKFLMKVKTPYEVLEESNQNKFMHEKFNFIDKKCQKLLEKARKCIDKNILFFRYGGETSMSSDLANQLSYEFPDKIVVVAYVGEVKVNVSLRGENVQGIISKAVEGLEGARGGGHKNAVGGQMKLRDLDEFKRRIFELVENRDGG